MNTFTFDDPVEPVVPASQPTSQPATSPLFRLLIVEDDEATAHMMLTALGHAGLECRHASDGASAVLALRANTIDLVLLDLNLPDISGQELCRQIRAESDLPVMVITGLRDTNLELQCLRSGADFFIEKPFVAKVLVARVIAMLRRTYRYNTSHDTQSEAQILSAAHEHEMLDGHHGRHVMPTDWSHCDSCDYMGPTSRFQRQDPTGQTVLICPHCHTRGSVTVVIG